MTWSAPNERAELAARHRANAIHVELPVQDTRTGLRQYRSAAQIFATWHGDGVLVPDACAVFYAYRMTVPGGSVTTGVIGALECEAPGGDILPHEQTIPKDKSDRLDLLRECRANLSPIWGLSLAPRPGRRLRARRAPRRRGGRRRRCAPTRCGCSTSPR